MIKKIISGICAAAVSVMTLLAPFPVYASDADVITSATSNATGKPGENVTIEVSIDKNPGLALMMLDIKYDVNTFEYVSGEQISDALTGLDFDFEAKNDQGIVRLMYLLDKVDDSSTGKIFKLVLKVKEGAVNGDYNIDIENADDLANSEEKTFTYGTTPGKITVTGGVSKNAKLSAITVNGTEIPDFDPDTKSYNYTVPFSEKFPPEVVGVVQDKDGGAVAGTVYDNDKNEATITVTAGDKTTTDTYTVVCTRQAQTAAPTINPNGGAVSRSKGEITLSGAGTIYYTTDGTKPTEKSNVYKAPLRVSDLVKETATELTINAVAIETDKALSEVTTAEFTIMDMSAALNDLKVNGTTIDGFSATKTAYTYTVSYKDWEADQTKEYEVTATAAAPATVKSITPAKVTLTANADTDKDSDKTTVTITVQPEDTTADPETYTVDFVVAACVHDDTKDANVVAATCTADGSKDIVCNICDKTIETGVVIPATGHDWDEGTQTAAPDCTNDGTMHFVCNNDASHTKDEPIDALGHDWSTEWTVTESDCVNDGEQFHACLRGCGEKNDIIVISAKGHQWSPWTSTDGTNFTRSCGVCGTTETQTVAAPADGHTHSFDGIVDVITPATCTSEGSQTRHCSVADCTATITESIPKLQHTEGTPTVVKEADCVSRGEIDVPCAICGKIIERMYLEALGHDYVPGNDTANCTTDGTITSTCSRCGDVKTEPSPAKGHTWGESWQGDASGHYHNCTVCGAKSEIQSHVSDNGVTSGNTVTYKCTVCGVVTRTDILSNGSAGGEHYYDGPVVVPFNNFNAENIAKKGPQIVGGSGKAGWDAIADEIDSAKSGSSIIVNAIGYTKIPSSVMKKLEGKNVTVTFEVANGVSWIVNGNDVSSPKTVDLGVKAGVNTIPSDLIDVYSYDSVTQISIKHDGSLGFTGELNISLGNKYNGMYANLFHYTDDSLAFVDSSVISDGKAKLVLDHASDYAIIISDESLGMMEDVSAAAGLYDENDFINNNGVISVVIIASAAVAALAILAAKKRGKNN